MVVVVVLFICHCTLNSIYNKVAFNKELAITKESLYTKYFPFTYKYISLNEKLPIMKENSPHIFCYRQSWVYVEDREACKWCVVVMHKWCKISVNAWWEDCNDVKCSQWLAVLYVCVISVWCFNGCKSQCIVHNWSQNNIKCLHDLLCCVYIHVRWCKCPILMVFQGHELPGVLGYIRSSNSWPVWSSRV